METILEKDQKEKTGRVAIPILESYYKGYMWIADEPQRNEIRAKAAIYLQYLIAEKVPASVLNPYGEQTTN